MCERKKRGMGPINDPVVSERTKLIAATLLFCLVQAKSTNASGIHCSNFLISKFMEGYITGLQNILI